MNEVTEQAAKTIFQIAEFFGVEIVEGDVIKELDMWNCSNKDISKQRYRHIESIIKEPFFISLFNIALAQYFYPPIYQILRECTGQGVTLHLTALIRGNSKLDFSPQKMKKGYETLEKILKIESRVENFLYTEFYADERLVMYLLGSDEICYELRGICNVCCLKEKCNEDYYAGEKDRLKEFLSEVRDTGRQVIVQISGEGTEEERINLLKAVYKKYGRILILADYDKLLDKMEDNEDLYKSLLNREILFYRGDICYYIHERDGDKKNCNIISPDINYHIYVIGKNIGSSAFPIINYTVKKYKGTKKDTLLAETAQRWGAGVRENDFCDIDCDGVEKVQEYYSFDDIKLSQKQRKSLWSFMNYIRYSDKVFYKWNMREKYHYGRNVTALFAGPPGTGKTMAAGAIANELKLPLYRVDLSTVMDKYIGETEKRLQKIFKSCEGKNVILFFDEADVIFGKRSDIKDGRDKFANSSVSFILQRIEQYEGMVILATNLKGNIDNAFLRRIKYVISFHMPDVKTRIEIWKAGFSKEIPTEGIDIDYLGRKIELSGGYIKNIIINAAFQAASEDSPVTMKHIMESVENEYEKLGMIMVAESFEEYGCFLQDSVREGRGEGNGIIYNNK